MPISLTAVSSALLSFTGCVFFLLSRAICSACASSFLISIRGKSGGIFSIAAPACNLPNPRLSKPDAGSQEKLFKISAGAFVRKGFNSTAQMRTVSAR